VKEEEAAKKTKKFSINCFNHDDMRVCSADEKRSLLTKLGFSFLKIINHIILISLLDDTMNPCVEIEKI